MPWRTLLGTSDEKVLLMWDEALLFGGFAPAEKCGRQSVKPSMVKA